MIGILVLLFVIPFIFLVLGLRFSKKYERLKSSESYESEAKKKALELKYRDPVISCDYCGNAIDTSIHKVCPVCGGEYSTDREWLERHKIDMKQFDDEASRHAEREIQKLEKVSGGLLKLYKVFLIISGVFFLVFVVLFVAFLIDRNTPDYTESESVNVYKSDNYVETGYEFIGDNEYINCDGLVAKITGVYHDRKSGYYKIESTITNNSDEDYEFFYSVLGVNGIIGIGGDGLHYSECVEPGKEIKLYDKIYEKTFNGIESIYIGRISVYEQDGKSLLRDESVHVIKTSYKYDGKCAITDGGILYEGNGIRVYDSGLALGHPTIAVENMTGDSIYLTIPGAKVNDTLVKPSSLVDNVIPDGCIYVSTGIYSIDAVYSNMKEDDKFYISLNIAFNDAPEKNFSTEYIELKRSE